MNKDTFDDVQIASSAADMIHGAKCALVITDKGFIMKGYTADLCTSIACSLEKCDSFLEVLEATFETLVDIKTKSHENRNSK